MHITVGKNPEHILIFIFAYNISIEYQNNNSAVSNLTQTHRSQIYFLWKSFEDVKILIKIIS